MKRIRIGNGCGFWGDNVDAPHRLAEAGRLDYLTLEYLAELTMSILALLRRRLVIAQREAAYRPKTLEQALRRSLALRHADKDSEESVHRRKAS